MNIFGVLEIDIQRENFCKRKHRTFNTKVWETKIKRAMTRGIASEGFPADFPLNPG